MGTSSQTEHKEECVHYGGTALGVGERRCPACPPMREFSPLLVSPESRTGGLCSGKMSVWSLFPCADGKRGGLRGDPQSWSLETSTCGSEAAGAPSSPAQGSLQAIQAGREREMLRNEWVLTNKK